ncbi:predicted protein [Chaetomium globosum CBS 148.51]|uniref:RING-type domain-containing protein n=1 Tax=Chaetomium globosum (strain ATCC 6205 / CBS 148.51 / DSM 1962 / NBRC 6347 / NRRL 1970) TaxID=306901 RepID=Q2H019_CHAGB|nr:uncharacterized protein CHGG_04877 [Chaetomium globosum CBS 148.51]EAQ88258.1 predicted protein [Chaetomium globosum CBS 148.51]
MVRIISGGLLGLGYNNYGLAMEQPQSGQYDIRGSVVVWVTGGLLITAIVLIAVRTFICLDGFEDESLVSSLPCYHVFHAVCIRNWFQTRRDTCPLCKARVPSGSQVETVLPTQPQRAVLPA